MRSVMGKLFIVNDDLSILRVLKMRLESDGYHVDVDSEIKAAKDLAVRNEYGMAFISSRIY